MSRSKKKVMPAEPVRARIESLNPDGRGVAHIEGKAVYIDDALPGEEVCFRYLARRRKHDEGKAVEIITASEQRVVPRCAHFGVCGGCSLQHMAPQAQIEAKQQMLQDKLERLGKVQPETLLPPISSEPWGYRRKARLGVKFVVKKDRLLIGFRERCKSFVTDLERCEVLHPSVGTRLPALRELVAGLSVYDQIPQIEVAVGDDATALVFRNLVELAPGDLDRLRAFGEQHDMHIYLQPGGPQSVTLLCPQKRGRESFSAEKDSRPLFCATELSYRLPKHNVELWFGPTDFTQVNAAVNRQMVTRALDLLDLQAQDRVLDLYCGLGNFTLPMARRAARVVGVEGDAELIRRARINAERNGIGNAEFHYADLADEGKDSPWLTAAFDKVLLDPPRTGAAEIVAHLPALGASRIVYVCCNPATLARDAHTLVHEHGYRLTSAGVMDMFPHTAHVESIALFERRG